MEQKQAKASKCQQKPANGTPLSGLIGKVGEFPDIENILFACILASVFVSVRK
jgi:hypothetical protein